MWDKFERTSSKLSIALKFKLNKCEEYLSVINFCRNYRKFCFHLQTTKLFANIPMKTNTNFYRPMHFTEEVVTSLTNYCNRIKALIKLTLKSAFVICKNNNFLVSLKNVLNEWWWAWIIYWKIINTLFCQ